MKQQRIAVREAIYILNQEVSMNGDFEQLIYKKRVVHVRR